MDEHTPLQKLLNDLSKRINFSQNTDAEDTADFNIFSILGVETKEVIICRFIGALLNAKGSHGMGSAPLVMFVNHVLGVENFGEKDAQKAFVNIEELIDNDRRVDIVIHSGKNVFPIEVKVWAGDQDAQLSDYYEYFSKRYGSKRVYYLTPTGWAPSAQSSGDLVVGSDIQLLSFEENIKHWVKGIQSISPKEEVKMCLVQMEKVINKMCDKNITLRQIQEELKLNGDFEVTPELKAAISLMNHKDTLFRSIKVSYLKKYLTFENKAEYELSEEIDASDENVDKHVVVKVVSKSLGKPVAWICVHTNLYLVAQNVNSPDNEELWDSTSSKEGNYFWAYLCPEEWPEKKYPMNKLEYLVSMKIDINKWLNDIRG